MDISSDYMINGTSDNQANNSLTDKELLNQFKIIEKLPEQDKSVVMIFLDAFITKRKLKQLALKAIKPGLPGLIDLNLTLSSDFILWKTTDSGVY